MNKLIPFIMAICLLCACSAQDKGESAAPAQSTPQVTGVSASPEAVKESAQQGTQTVKPEQDTAEQSSDAAAAPLLTPAVRPPADAQKASPAPGRTDPTTSTNPSAQPDAEEEQDDTVSVVITGPDGELLNTTVETTEIKTAYDALSAACAANSLQLDIKGSGAAIYIKGIAGVMEFDHGPLSGWMYRVNGETPSTGIGGYEIKAGDTLNLFYTQSFGKDEQ